MNILKAMKTSIPTPFTPTSRALGLGLWLVITVGGLSVQGMAEVADPLLHPAAPPLPVKILAAPGSPGAPAQCQGALVWDSEFKEISTKPGEATASFTFWFTNASASEVTINSVRASCGCTTAKMAALPWKIAPGTNGPIEVSVDLRGKQGVISKAVTVDSTAGAKSLTFKINIPAAQPAQDNTRHETPVAPLDADRVQNMQLSLHDRQVVFKDAQCATCHADPAKGQTDGALLYSSVCATCHDSPMRASLVPDLRALKQETDLDYWKQWIAHGRTSSMMPAFARSEGGPLDDRQIVALAAYCAKTFQPAGAHPRQIASPRTNGDSPVVGAGNYF